MNSMETWAKDEAVAAVYSRIAAKLRKAVEAIDPGTGEIIERHASVLAAARWAAPASKGAGNISRAVRNGHPAYGFLWRRAVA